MNNFTTTGYFKVSTDFLFGENSIKGFLTSLLLLMFGAMMLISCSSGENQAEEKYNVVFFLVDDMGWTDLGCYGSTFYETPKIDQFSRESVKFTNAYAACHVCSPTRASILTGKYPATLHLTDWLPGRKDFTSQRLLNADKRQYLPFEEKTIAEKLKAHGYHTSIFGKWHLGEDPSGPAKHGFDVVVPQNWNRCCPNKGYHAPFGLDGIDDKEGDYLTDRLTDEAIKYLEAYKDQPFFMYLSHFAVHDPIEGRADLVKKYRAKKKNVGTSELPYILEGNPDNPDNPDRAALHEYIDQQAYNQHAVLPNQTVKIKQIQDNPEFAGMVESIDESFGRILAKLEELNLDQKTIVIFFSDNGGMAAGNFGNPERIIKEDELDWGYATANLPLRGAKGWLYEGGIREPLMIKWPGHTTGGTVCDVPVISTDFYPSILEMLNIPGSSDSQLDGASLVKLLTGQKELNRDAIYWHFPHYSNHGMQSPGGAIRSGDFKLLEYYENGTVQLFNLKVDIGEQNDLADDMPEKVSELKNKLHQWRQQVHAQMMEPNPDYLATGGG